MNDLKMGDIVEIKCGGGFEDGIFLKDGKDGGVICVDGDDKERFNNGEHFYVTSWDKSQWRIKEKPVRIPFDESDAEFLIGKAIKIGQDVFLIVRINNHGAIIVDGDNCFIGFTYLLQNYTFLKGSPCGKLK